MTVTDTAVITCFFNFNNFLAPQRNLRRWQRQMTANRVPVFGVELVVRGQESVTKGWPGWHQLPIVRDLHTMFQKEAALNLIQKMVPTGYTKLVVCDCDVWFDNPDWLAQTSAVLNIVNTCSPFELAAWTSPTGEVFMTRPAFGTDPQALHPGWKVHAGFAIALRRDFWNPQGVNGIYPYAITGSGDVATGVALAQLDPSHKMFTAPGAARCYLEWYDRVGQWVQGISYVPGTVYHEYHGTRENRQYVDRHDWIASLSPGTHLKFTNEGILEWTPLAPEDMKAKLADYFRDRKEDE